MEATVMYKDRAIIFDPNCVPGGWDNPNAVNMFIREAVLECDGFLPTDWVVDWDYTILNDQPMVIEVRLQRYADGQNLQTRWAFNLVADPVDDLDNQWIVFDVIRFDAHRTYRFQMP